MSVIIGIDPHKLLHAACAIDRTRDRARPSSRSAPGHARSPSLLAWAAPFECRTWAIESAGGLGYLLAQQLVARGEHVVDVPATLSSRVRLLGSGRSNKNDANDARAVAVAALRSPSSGAVRVEDHVHDAAAARQSPARRVSRARSRACCRLHALVARVGAGRDPQGNRGHAGRTDPRRRSSRRHATQRQRLELAHETFDEIVHARRPGEAHPRQRITDAVIASGTSLTDIFGVGPIIAATDHRLHRRHHPVPDRRALRRVQRDRPDRVLLVGSHRAPVVASREPDVEPRDPHDRRHPDPPRATARAAATTTASSPRARHHAKRRAR